MAGRKTDASIAFSVTDNVSESVRKMRSAMLEFKDDAEGLQQRLETLENARLQLKNIDLTDARRQLAQAKKELEELGDTATEADREAARANFETASKNYENIRNQLSLVSKQARATTQDLLDSTGAITRAENRAGTGGSSLLGALGTAGLLDMAGDAALEITNAAVSSALGSSVGGIASSAIGGAVSGAAMGSLLGPTGSVVGSIIGGGLGLIQGGTQMIQGMDQAFINYYTGAYDTASAATDDSLSSGGDTAAQRELDAIAFNRLLGDEVGDQFLADLRQTAADTPMEYEDLTGISRALATGFGDAPDRMLELITAIGDAGSAVGVTASDMEYMAQAMSRMESSGKTTLEYLNIFQDRGVDVIEMLSETMGKTQGEIYDMISKGEIKGQDAVDIIQQGMVDQYSGAMEAMAQTFPGLTSTLEDAMTEINNAMGDAYNEKSKEGLQADIDAYGGTLGEAISEANAIIGEGRAISENLARQYDREAMAALTQGAETTVYSEGQAAKLESMHNQYTDLVNQYQTATEEDKAVIAAQIEALMEEAQVMADSNYDASDMAQQLHDVNLDQITAIRENTAALKNAPWMQEYETEQAQSIGLGEKLLNDFLEYAPFIHLDSPDEQYDGAPLTIREGRSHAFGLYRVPYDNYPAILHEDERVLTAREARERDSSRPIQITVSGNTFGADLTAEAVAEALADAIAVKLAAGYGGG